MSIENYITSLRKDKNIIISVEGNNIKILDPQENLTNEIIDEIKSKKAEILEFYTNIKLRNDAPCSNVIPKANPSLHYALSAAQNRLYFLYEFDKTSLAYNMPLILKLEGTIDKKKFNDTFISLINRHESLRTSFEVVNGLPIQKISEQVAFEVGSYKSNEENVDIIINEFIKPFDLSKAPLLRASLVEISSAKHILMVDMHHILTDGISQDVLIKDFMALYNNLDLPELRIHYKDYVEWYISELNQKKLLKQREYWLSKLSGEIPVLNLPVDFERSQNQRNEADIFKIEITKDDTKSLKSLLNKHSDVTTFTFLIAAYNVLLGRLCDQDDIIIGCPVINRPHIELEKTIGLFLNTLPLRNSPNRLKNFITFLHEVKDSILEAFQNQDYQYEDMVSELKLNRSLKRNPLFDTFFNFLIVEQEEVQRFNDLSVKPYNNSQSTTKFDITIIAQESNSIIHLNCVYKRALFRKETINYIFTEFRKLLHEIIVSPDKLLGDYNIFNQKDLPVGSNTIIPVNSFQYFPEEEIFQSIPERFQKIVKIFPNKIAVKSENKQLTYLELDKQSNQVGREVLKNYNDKYLLSKDEKIMYTRQMMLDGWGIAGQEKLKSSTVFVAGAGGSGSPVITQLALAGIGNIIICDYDEVELSNLNRQFLHDRSRIGMNKAESAKLTILRINPNVNVITIKEKISKENISEIAGSADMIFDNVDDMEAKFVISEFASQKGIPHIISSMMETSSYVCIFHTPFTPCFHCLYDKSAIKDIEIIRNKYGKENKNANPVSSSALFVSAGFAVNEAIKILLQNENPAYNKYFFFNQKATSKISETKGYMAIIFPFSHHFKKKCKEQGFDWEIGWSGKFLEELHIEKNPDCPVCNSIGSLKHLQKPQVSLDGSENESKKNQTVALLLNHNEKIQISILGVLKSGKAYVPIDPSYPENRIAEILDDSLARMIITDKHNFELAKRVTYNVNKNIYILNIDEINSSTSDSDIQFKVDSNDLCYILYTSGSTGKPKGVMQSHKNALHFCRVYTNALHISPEDKLTMLSNYCFDASKMSTFGALLNGATLYPYSIKDKGVEGLRNLIQEENLTIYHSTPSVYRYFVNTLINKEHCQSLRLIVMGGEAVGIQDVENFKNHFSDRCLFINGLGPTESTVTIQNFIDKNTDISGSSVPIGYPVDKTKVYIIRQENQLADVFEFGEILYQSNHLALGYWNDVEKTKQAFPVDIVNKGERYYKSGDIGRMLPSGMLEFKGRNDNQVKIRGQRVELGEIENQLASHEKIKGAIVIVKEKQEDKYIIAYYVSDLEIEIADLNALLSQKLPEFMIPSYYVHLNSIPLTPNGKIDKKALPDPEIKIVNEYLAPSNDIDNKLVDIWVDVLKIEREQISVNRSFFDLGGHSLKAILVLSKIHNVFNIVITLDEFFSNSTILEIEKIVNSKKNEKHQESDYIHEREEIEI